MPGHGLRQDKFTAGETLDYALKEYDFLRKVYSQIDVLGYSLGGVLACYIAQFRKIDRLILLAPAFNYINIENYKPRIIQKSHIGTRDILSLKKVQYFFVFSKIVRIAKEHIRLISCPVCIIWGEDDFLVSKKSGTFLFRISTNETKYFITLKNHNHYNIVKSWETVRLIQNFLNK